MMRINAATMVRSRGKPNPQLSLEKRMPVSDLSDEYNTCEDLAKAQSLVDGTIRSSGAVRCRAHVMHTKRVVYRRLFRNWCSNSEAEHAQRNLSLFHDHLARLCEHVFPFTLIKKDFPDYQLNETVALENNSEALPLPDKLSKTATGKFFSRIPVLRTMTRSHDVSMTANKRTGTPAAGTRSTLSRSFYKPHSVNKKTANVDGCL